jgi:hypothetical protein
MPTRSARPLAGAGAEEAAPGYLTSETHYLSVAGRLLAALRGEVRLIVVTGDPLAEPQPLSEALGKLAGQRQTITRIACRPGPTMAEEVSGAGAGAVIVRRTADGGMAVPSDAAEIGSSLFVFEEADRLSDQQIEEICAATRSTRPDRTGVLLAHQEFLARLDQPPLQRLKEVFAPLRFDEIGSDEAIDFLRHQVAVRRSQEEESRIRPIFFRGLAVFGVLAAVIVGASFVLHLARTPEMAAPAERSVPSAGYAFPAIAPHPAPVPPVEPPGEPPGAASPAAPAPSKPTAASPLTPPLSQPQELSKPSSAGAAPDKARDAGPPREPGGGPETASGPRPSAEVAALVARGDKFLGAGDIASARLFYERAADAGNGGAALRLGATFDPNFLGRAGVLGSPGDPAQAAAWYRRARDLGDAAAAERLKALTR